ncbi:MAG: hypothetical protein A2W25_14700 [candidate division Zixibacteria bacterium RBG_16_53_22]|nr:MAG: hypothetical protein A2W25_14700 [candidate division Zixibacteria bacterium RBG_16_53_22]
MSRVFVSHEPHRIEAGQVKSLFDLTPAAEYGDIEVLMPAGSSLLSTVPMVRTMRDRLANFSDDDYLLPVGDPSAIMAAGAIASEMNNGRVKILRWDRATRRYIVIQFDVSGRAV